MLLVTHLALAVAGIDLALVAYILCRRASRNRFFRQKDEAERRYASAVLEFLTGSRPISEAAQRLRVYRRAEREAIKALIIGNISGSTQERATDLLDELGFIEQWTEDAFGAKRARQLLISTESGTAR
jgi:beta-phosphoglucomutase-like phosphatase (HAD superfamily)